VRGEEVQVCTWSASLPDFIHVSSREVAFANPLNYEQEK